MIRYKRRKYVLVSEALKTSMKYAEKSSIMLKVEFWVVRCHCDI